MKKIKKIILFIFSFIIVFSAIFYLTLVFILPIYVNSPKFTDKLNSVLNEKYGITYIADNFEFSISPFLKADISATNFSLSDKDKKEIVSFKYLKGEYDTFHKKPLKLEAENLLVQYKPTEKKKSKTKFSPKKYYNLISEIDLKNSSIIITNKDNIDFKADISSLLFFQNSNSNKVEIKAKISSSVLNNNILVGESGALYFIGDDLYSDNLSVSFGNSAITANGLIYGENGHPNFNITGKNIPVSELQASLLYFQKLRKKDKVFIENFYNFSGTADIDLKVNNEGLFGFCKAKKLAAKSVLFNVPIVFDEAVFDFDKRQINSYAEGKIGTDKVNSIFMLEGMATPKQTVNGVIKSKLTNNTVQKYVPHTRIKGYADTTVYYGVEDHKISVNYLLKINQGSELYYKTADLGLEDKNRQLFVQTYKHDDVLEITSYAYSTVAGAETKDILTGGGLFRKVNGKLKLDYITCKTLGYAPVSVTGSFGEYLQGGMFNGDLIYYHKTKQLTGDFSVINSTYKDFYLEEAVFSADKEKMNIFATGTYNKEKFDCKINAQNDFGHDKINIYNMDLFLDKFHIKRGGNKTNKIAENSAEIIDKVTDTDITIQNWEIRLNKILSGKILVEHIYLTGNLKNNIFSFKSENAKFANGTLHTNGKYNFNNHSSKVEFFADNVNSNLAAEMVLGLKNQVEGLAFAHITAQTEDFFDTIRAHADFDIRQGFLPQIGSTEFMIKKSSDGKKPLKIRIQDIVNIDISKEKALVSRIKGSFDIENYDVNNIYLTSQQQFLSFLLKGNYVMDEQNADLKLWGKYNKSAGKKVKILFVPLTWIVKVIFRPENTKELYKKELSEVPKIQACGDEEQSFRVKMKGNLNTKDIDVELKRIF